MAEVAIKVVSSVPSPPAVATVDPWIPLSVVWEIDPFVSPLYLFVHDPEQGYVELKIHPQSGALVGIVLIDLPRTADAEPATDDAAAARDSESPVLDLTLWSWKETPDYREPTRRDIDVEAALSLSSAEDMMSIWFEAKPVARFLQAGNARVGVSRDDELVVITVSGLPRSSSGAVGGS